MIKTCLINPPHMVEKEKDFGRPPLPLLSVLTLGTMLKKKNMPLEIIDLQLLIGNKELEFNEDFYEKAVKLIDSKKAGVLGFTAMCSNYPLVLSLARKCKESNPKYWIVLGGAQATATAEGTLKNFPFIDVIVCGEGDITIVELVKRLTKGKNLAGLEGISYRDGEAVIHNGRRELIKDLDELPILDYGLVPLLSEYQGEKKSYIGNMEVGRGCPYNCTYCSTNLHWQKDFRVKSAERIIEEIIFLKKNYNIKTFEFTHDLFTLDKKKLKKLCNLIIKKKLNIGWGCHSRADSFDIGDGILKLMAKAGCRGLFYGVESGSKAIQRLMKKNIDLNKAESVIKETIKNDIPCMASFIVGFPEEKEEDLNDTLSFALRLVTIDYRVRVQIGLLSPAPGTEVMEKHKNDMTLTECISCFTTFSSCLKEEWEMIRKHPNIFSVFYNLRTKYVPLEVFVFVQDWGLMLISYLPNSLLMFCRELKITPLEAIYLWIEWWKKSKHEITTTTDFDIAYEYFYEFTREAFTERVMDFSFLKDVLEYERRLMLIKVMERREIFSVSKKIVDNILSGDWEKAVPKMSSHVLIGSFSYDVKKYIEGRTERDRDKYKTQPRQHYGFIDNKNIISVKRLSEKTRDFLNEINGKRTFDQVIDRFNLKHSVPRGKILQFLRGALRNGIIEIKNKE